MSRYIPPEVGGHILSYLDAQSLVYYSSKSIEVNQTYKDKIRELVFAHSKEWDMNMSLIRSYDRSSIRFYMECGASDLGGCISNNLKRFHKRKENSFEHLFPLVYEFTLFLDRRLQIFQRLCKYNMIEYIDNILSNIQKYTVSFPEKEVSRLLSYLLLTKNEKYLYLNQKATKYTTMALLSTGDKEYVAKYSFLLEKEWNSILSSEEGYICKTNREKSRKSSLFNSL